MTTGTLTLTQNSTAVVGTGTLFTTELEVGGVIYVSLSGVNHTLVVSSIASNTQLTLARAFTGATQSGITWTAIARDALIGIHAQLAADNAWARRAAVLDKQNWYQVFTGEGAITITLPDGSTFSGPSWAYLVSTMATKVEGAVPIAQGGTGATTPAGARTNLELGNAAIATIQTSTVDYVSGHLLTVGGFGLGESNTGSGAPISSGVNYFSEPTGFWQTTGDSTGDFPTDTSHYGQFIRMRGSKNSVTQIYATNLGVAKGGRIWYRTLAEAVTTPGWQEFYTTYNTTQASDGTIKAASPVIKIFADGTYETNDESEGVIVTHLDVGRYLIEGCEALNSDAAWGGIDGGFDIPTDRNKQPLLWLDYEVNADGSVLVKTYHRTHTEAPEFARNLIGYKNNAGEFIETIANGEPVDIPSDQFVSVRVEMPKNSIWNQRQAELAEADRITSEMSSEEE